MNIQRDIELDKDPFSQRILKTDPCPYIIKYSLDVLNKNTRVLDILNTDKKCLIEINIESSPSEIWSMFSQRIRIPITGKKSVVLFLQRGLLCSVVNLLRQSRTGSFT